MPWTKEQRARYPANWKEIRARILDRDEHKCKHCGVKNHLIGTRDADGTFHELNGTGDAEAEDGIKVIMIVLTIAHLHDPDPMNVDDANLAALCQRCHNLLDLPMRVQHAAETRRAKKIANGQGELFGAASDV